MKMKVVYLISVSILLLCFAEKSKADDTRDKFMQFCTQEQGEDAQPGLCDCGYQKWSESITEEEQENAALAVDIMVTQREPSMDEAFQVMSHMQNYSMAIFECMQLGDDTLANMMSGAASGDDIVQQLMAEDKKREEQRQQRREQQRIAQESEANENERLRQEWESQIRKEDQRIGNPLESSPSEFKKLSYLFCEGPKKEAKSNCDCRWQQIRSFDSGVSTRVTNAATHLLATDYIGDLPYNVSSIEFRQILDSREKLDQQIQTQCN